MRTCLYCGHTIEDDALTECPKCKAPDPAVQPVDPGISASPIARGSTIDALGGVSTQAPRYSQSDKLERDQERARCLAWVQENGVAVDDEAVVAGIVSGAWPSDHGHEAAESDADGVSGGAPGY